MTTAVVIGAGFGGLAAALSLAGAGVRVRVFDGGARVGGKADAVAGPGGLRVDTGPSLFTLPDVARQVFEGCGARLEDHVTLRPLGLGFLHCFPDGVRLATGAVPGDPSAALAHARDALGAREAHDLERLLEHARRIWEAAAPAFVYGDAPSLRQLVQAPVASVRSLAAIDGRRSLWDAVCALTRSPHLRAVFARFATYSGSDPRTAPATLLCVAWVELGLGGYGVAGGISAVARAMAERLTALGASVETERPVAHIRVAGGRAVGVELADGTYVPADLVVSNADTAALFDTLLPTARLGLRGRLHRASRASTPSMSGWNAVVPGAGPAAHTVVYPPARAGQTLDDAYLDEFRALFDHGGIRPSPTVYACDQARAHDGAAALFLMVNAPAASAWQRLPAETAQRLEADALARLEAIGARVDGPPVFRRTPEGLAQRFPSSDGALYGAASNSRLAAFVRPSNRVDGVAHLYVASGTAHPGGGVPLAMLSGLAAARAALADVGRRAA